MDNKKLSVGTWKLARAYLEAGSRLNIDLKLSERNMPAYFLFCHSIELSFKSFLLAQGSSDRELRKIGHDLAKAMQATFSRKGFSSYLSERQIGIIEMLNPYYCGKQLEYAAFTKGQFPAVSEVESTASALLFGVIPEEESSGGDRD